MYQLNKKILAVLLIFAHITSVFGVEVSKCNMSGNVDVKIIGIDFTLNAQHTSCCSCEMYSQGNQETKLVLKPLQLNIPQNNKNDDASSLVESTGNQGCCTVNYKRVDVPTEIYSNPISHIKVLQIADFAVHVFPIGNFNSDDSEFLSTPQLIHNHAVFGETPPIYHFCQLRL